MSEWLPVCQAVKASALKLFMFLSQIIHKIKLQRSEVDMTPSEICDRIFALVDQNHDGEKQEPLKMLCLLHVVLHVS